MIAGTAYSPSKAFIAFAREFFESIANDDVHAALARLDVSTKRWTKKELLTQLGAAIGSERVCSAIFVPNESSS